jgi:hypothetical protein
MWWGITGVPQFLDVAQVTHTRIDKYNYLGLLNHNKLISFTNAQETRQPAPHGL